MAETNSDHHPERDRSIGRALAQPFRQTAADFRDPNRSTAQKVGLAAAVAFVWLSIIPALAAIFVILHVPGSPGATEIQRETETKPSIVLAADGSEIAQFQRADRMWVPLDSVAQPFLEALLATEDRRFYQHRGIDLRRSIGAGFRTVTGRLEGGSTLTQQLARTLYPDEIGRTISIRRKAREMITARRIERSFEKEQILEAYVNTVPFLYNAFGVEMAARTYFDKSAHELDVVEAATLVGMLKGTSYYNPVRNPERAESRRNVVLRLMADHGYIDSGELDSFRERPLEIDFSRIEGPRSEHPHFTRFVREWLSEWADRHRYDLFSDGLVIHTTLDPNLQRAAEAAATRRGDILQRAAEAQWSDGSGSPFGAFWSRNPQFEEQAIRGSDLFRSIVAEGTSESAALDSIRSNPTLRDSVRSIKSRVEIGFVALEPGTGNVRAWVGSRNFERTPLDHVWQTRRQPGSTFKPFVYAAALQRGFLPGDAFTDEQYEFDVGNGQRWRPANYGHHYTGAPMTLTEALAYSKNAITAKLMMEVGPASVVSLARDAGVRESSLRPVPSLALGTSEVTLLEMVNSFGTFAASGRYHEPVPVTRVEDGNGRVLASFNSSSEQVLSEDVAQTITLMLKGAIDRGTGSSIRTTYGIRGDVAGKTGTSQRGADGWFVMMHPNLVAGAWVGFPEPIMTWRSSAYGQASRNALPVVGEFFRDALPHIPDGSFATPARYSEPGSIWQRARSWWEDLLDREDLPDDIDEDYFLNEVPYDDLSEWDLDDGIRDTLDDFDFDLDLDEPTDLEPFDPEDSPAPDLDEPDDPEPIDVDPTETRPPDPPDNDDQPPTAVQRLYDELGEDLDDDLDGGGNG